MDFIKKYVAKRREKKRIAQQYKLEKKNVDYFKTSVPHWYCSLDDIAKSVNLSDKGVYMLGLFSNATFLMQAVELKRLYEGGEPKLYYGDYSYRSPFTWLASVEDFPKEMWFSVEEYQCPTRPALLLCEYSSGHYEVVEYSNKVWTTELCFPVKPTRYFVLDFLTEGK